MAAAMLLVAGIAAARATADRADAVRAELGRRLFYDADLSADGSMACATCHEQHHGFAEGNRTHAGVHGDPGRRNVPGLANVGAFRSFTWADPHIRTLDAQVLVPVMGETPVEMGMHGGEAEVARRIGRDPCYRTMFAAAFPRTGGRIDIPAIATAIAAFERTMISRDAPYDRAKSGGQPLDPSARRGEMVFDRGCAGCHAGPLFTDQRFHRILPAASADRGLGEITGRAADDGRFRTPSLRNVAVTGPYFHDGSAATLSAAIERHQIYLDPAQMADVIAFLKALTDTSFLSNDQLSYPDHSCDRFR